MQFHLQVQGPAGSQALAIDAASEAEAIRAAVRGGWRVLAVDAGAAQETGVALRPGKQGLPLLQFSQELLALLEAGLNLGEAMATLHNKETRPSAKATLAAIVLTLQQGLSFSDTLAGFPDIFPDIYIATV
ncbi:type II secretion system F family protein, partial [Janthinobacterium lividum]